MNFASISQAIRAVLPIAQAPSVERSDPAATSRDAGGGRQAQAHAVADSVTVPSSIGGSLLTALETNALHAQLPPSLSDTLARVSTALDLTPADAPAPVPPQSVAPEPAEASHTLQQMAQVTAHVDIAAERHGDPANRSTPEAKHTAQNAEPLATPSTKDVQLTPAVASLLHVPAARLQADAPPPHPQGTDGDRSEQGSSHEDDLPAAPDDEAAEARAPHHLSPRPAAPVGTHDDAQLYQQIVCALHGRRNEDDAVERALEELSRQRRVVLATPAGPVAGLRCLAHVDVLWPQRGRGRAVRLAGELLWSQATTEAAWLEGHLVKSQGPGSVRQLVPVAAQVDVRRIAVCLGAQAVPMTAWSQACLRVRDGNRLWQALAPQWSLRVIIGRHPLELRASPAFAGGNGHAA